MATIDTSELRHLADEWYRQAAYAKETWGDAGLPMEGSAGDLQVYCVNACAGGLVKAIERAEASEAATP